MLSTIIVIIVIIIIIIIIINLFSCIIIAINYLIGLLSKNTVFDEHYTKFSENH